MVARKATSFPAVFLRRTAAPAAWTFALFLFQACGDGIDQKAPAFDVDLQHGRFGEGNEHGPFARPLELEKIAGFLELSVDEFTEKFCNISTDRRGLVLKCNDNDSCIMLDTSNRCVIHEAKPAQCSGFPHSWRNPDSDAVCPAMRR